MKTPMWQTAKTYTPTGKSIRIARQAMPRWGFSLKFSYLNRLQRYPFVAMVPVAAALIDVSNLVANDFNALAGFVNGRQGAYDSFLFEDPTDEAVAQAQMGTGDGSSLSFQLTRQMGEFAENVQNINGTPVAASIWQPNTLVAAGALVVPTPQAIRSQQNPLLAAWQSQGWPTYYLCTTAGRTGLVEPQWRQSATQPVTDNTAVFSAQGAPLIMYIEQALPDWAAGAKTLNQAIKPLTGNAGGFTFICTAAGAGASQPVWPQSLGATVGEGGAVWTNYGVSTVGVFNPIVPQLPSQYTLGSTGIVTFSSAPSTRIFATFSFWFRCAFTDDSTEFELMMSQFYSVGKLSFESLII